MTPISLSDLAHVTGGAEPGPITHPVSAAYHGIKRFIAEITPKPLGFGSSFADARNFAALSYKSYGVGDANGDRQLVGQPWFRRYESRI